jgi:glycosyltransferase involved in cell wall biosynthesis
MIINSIRQFAQRGFAVDVFIDRETFHKSPVSFREEDVSLIVRSRTESLLLKVIQVLIGKTLARFGACERLSGRLAPSRTVPMFYPVTCDFAAWLGGEISKNNYRFIIPVDTKSLLCLHKYPHLDRVIYFDMELLDWGRSNPLYKSKLILKNIEYVMIQAIGHVAVPSPKRAELFCEINKFPLDRLFVLPVAAMGEPIMRKGNYFRERFRIADHRTVIVYSGNFLPWSLSLEVVESVSSWPEDTALVMHTWNREMRYHEYFLKMQRTAVGRPVYFSFDYIPYDELAAALSSADIGIMFYQPINGNFTEILFSSNKLAEYLKAGLPVICSDFPSLKAYISERNIGATIPSPAQLPYAIEEVLKRKEILRQNAIDCYLEDFQFEKYFDSFFEQLDGDRSKPNQNEFWAAGGDHHPPDQTPDAGDLIS